LHAFPAEAVDVTLRVGRPLASVNRMSNKGSLFCIAVWLGSVAPAAAQVHLTMNSGRISLVAQNATLSQILAEWSRVGQTTIVNGDRVPDEPLNLQFNNVPEEEVLDTLLRPLSGYVAGTRDPTVQGLARFDRIVIMPTHSPASIQPADVKAPIRETVTEGEATVSDESLVETVFQQDNDRAGAVEAAVNSGPPMGAANGPTQMFPAGPGIVTFSREGAVTGPAAVGVATPGMMPPARSVDTRSPEHQRKAHRPAGDGR